MIKAEKLQLIEDYNKEYYQGRFFSFVKGGFVTMQPIKIYEGNSVHINDIYVAPEYRGTGVLDRLSDIIAKYVSDNDVKVVFCRVEKGNPFYDLLVSYYKSHKFFLIHEDNTAQFYRRNM